LPRQTEAVPVLVDHEDEGVPCQQIPNMLSRPSTARRRPT
jgi:hypothetical protein